MYSVFIGWTDAPAAEKRDKTMKIVTIAWIDGNCVGEATAEQLEQHRLGTLPANVELEQEGRFDPNDGSVPDCDVRMSWNGRLSFMTWKRDGKEWARRAERCKLHSWNDIEECDESDTYWDRCLRILSEGKRDFKVEIYTPYDANNENNIKRVAIWAEDLISHLRPDSDGKKDADLWAEIHEGWEDADWQKANNLDDGPADLPTHQYYDFFRHLWRHTANLLGQTPLERREAWHLGQKRIHGL